MQQEISNKVTLVSFCTYLESFLPILLVLLDSIPSFQKDKSLKYLAPIVTLSFLAADQLSFMNPLRKWPAMLLQVVVLPLKNAIGTDMTGTMCFVVITGHMTKIANALHD